MISQRTIAQEGILHAATATKGWIRRTAVAVAGSTLLWMLGCNGSTPGLVSTAVAVSASSASVNVGTAVTLTATFTPGSPAGIGTITFLDGGNPLQVVDVTGQTTVTTTTSSLAAGPHSITAAYGGDPGHAASTSAAVTVNVYQPTTTTLAASPTLAAVGDPVTLTATVAAGSSAATGSVSFASGGTVLGSAPLSTTGTAQTATLVTTALPLGTDAVVATFAASGSFLASTSTAATVQIHAALIKTTLTLGTNPVTTIAAGTQTTLTATLAPASAGASAATGTVTFYDGSVVLGVSNVVGNVAVLGTKQFNVGANSLSAVYSGDVLYAGSTSGTVGLAMTAYTGATYTNPLNVQDPKTGQVYNCPDPAVVKLQNGGTDTWYAYCTGDAFNGNDTAAGGALNTHLISIFSSPDLVNWTYVRDAFTALPTWVKPGQELQTPAIKVVNGQYLLYYEAPAVAAAPNGSAIGVGIAATPAGPFVDSGAPVVGQQIACGGNCNRTVFSPEVIADGSGQLWIVYGGTFAGIGVRKLNAAGTVSDPTTEISIAVDNYYQDPFLTYKNGYFYEFVTAGGCCGGAYSTDNVHVGRSASITGPYLDAEGNDLNAYDPSSLVGAPGGDPVLVMNGDDIVGAGSNAIFTDESGQDYILYSGVSKKQQYLPGITGYTARQLMLDALDWPNGWPKARNGNGPSDYTLPQPVPAAQPNAANGYVPPPFTPDMPGTAIVASSDDFNETTLSAQWSFLHTSANYTMTGTEYAVQSVNAESTVNMSQLPILAEPEPAGNYLMEVKLSSSDAPNGYIFNYNQAGVLIYSSDTDYLRLDEVPVFETRQIEFLNQFAAGGVAFAPVGTPNFYASTYLRIAKRVGTGGAPDTYTAYSSVDGLTYLKGPTWTASYGTTGKIGLFAGNTSGYTASFDYIHVTTLLP